MHSFEPTDYSDFEPVGGPEAGADDAEAAEAVSVEILNPLVGSRTYRLLAPLKVNGKTVRVIRMRHLRQEEIDSFAGRPFREMMAKACDLPPAVLGALIWPDSEAVHSMFDDMLPLGGGA